MTRHSVAIRPSDKFLDNLLERMPAGLPQMIGGTGWRLSHGERSRLFMARALYLLSLDLRLSFFLAAREPMTFSRICTFERQ